MVPQQPSLELLQWLLGSQLCADVRCGLGQAIVSSAGLGGTWRSQKRALSH